MFQQNIPLFCNFPVAITIKLNQWKGKLSDSPIVGENPPEVRVVAEVDTEHVPHLPLVPVGGLHEKKAFSKLI